jgi:hypothetical protein
MILYPSVLDPSKSTKRRLVTKFRTGSSLSMTKRRQQTRRVLSYRLLDENGTRLEAFPPKSVRHHYSKPVCQSQLYTLPQNYFFWKHTHLRLCKNSRKQIDLQGHVFVIGSVKQCVVVKIIHSNFFVTGKAYFYLNDHINTQNSRYCSADSPRLIHKVLLHDVNFGVWCVVSATTVIRPNFFPDTINSERHTGQILAPFFNIYVKRKVTTSSSSKMVLLPIERAIQRQP